MPNFHYDQVSSCSFSSWNYNAFLQLELVLGYGSASKALERLAKSH